jgi:hypothetical protein
LVLLIFLLTPGFAPLAKLIGQAVVTAIFYSILISSRLDNSPLKSLWTIMVRYVLSGFGFLVFWCFWLRVFHFEVCRLSVIQLIRS